MSSFARIRRHQADEEHPQLRRDLCHRARDVPDTSPRHGRRAGRLCVSPCRVASPHYRSVQRCGKDSEWPCICRGVNLRCNRSLDARPPDRDARTPSVRPTALYKLARYTLTCPSVADCEGRIATSCRDSRSLYHTPGRICAARHNLISISYCHTFAIVTMSRLVKILAPSSAASL